MLRRHADTPLFTRRKKSGHAYADAFFTFFYAMLMPQLPPRWLFRHYA